MIVAKTKQMAYFVSGVSFGLIFYEVIRSVSYFIFGASPEMGLIVNVIFSPVLSIPFGFFCYMCFFCFFRWSKAAKEWFGVGCCFSFFFPVMDMLFLIMKYFKV